MTLTQALTALAGNTGVNITLNQKSGDVVTPLITFNAPGYASVESDLMSKTVNSITVTSSKSITIEINAGA